MNKVKKTLIAAGIFLAVGFTGSIVTGARMVPEIINEAYRVQNEILTAKPTEREIFATAEVVENLDVSSLIGGEFTVEIKPSTDKQTRVKVYEYLDNDIKVESSYDAGTKALNVQGQRDRYHIFQQKGIKETIKRGYDTLIYTLAEERNKESQIVIEVPSGVNVNFNGNNYSKLVIRDKAVVVASLVFKCNGGFVDLPLDNNLKNIDIRTNSYFEMDIREFINADNVTIDAHDIRINSRGYAADYKGITKVPAMVNIKGYYVNVESYMPLGTEVNISASEVDYESNLNTYPVKLKLNGYGSSSAYFNENDNNSSRSLGDYFEGVLVSGDDSPYKLIINDFNHCEIDNKTDIKLENDLR